MDIPYLTGLARVRADRPRAAVLPARCCSRSAGGPTAASTRARATPGPGGGALLPARHRPRDPGRADRGRPAALSAVGRSPGAGAARRLRRHGPLRVPPGPALPAPELVGLVRLQARAVRPRAVRAHARMLASRTSSRADDLAAIERGLATIRRRDRRRQLRRRPGRRGHPHGDRAAADRADRRRSAASSTRPARATTRWRPTSRCSCARTPSRPGERCIDADAGAHRRAEEHLDWRMPAYTHLQRAQPVLPLAPPARVLLEVQARPRALRLLHDSRPTRCPSARAPSPA